MNYLLEGFKQFWKYTIIIWKSIFYAVTQVAWGLSGLFLMSAAITYLREKYTFDSIIVDKFFGMLATFIIEHTLFFVYIFFFFSIIVDRREIFKK